MKRILTISVILAAILLTACAAPATTPEPTPPPMPSLPPFPSAPSGLDQSTWGESRTNPVAWNYGLTYGDYKLRVQCAGRFDKIGSQTPQPGKTWVVVGISCECLSPCDFDAESLQIVGNSNRVYEACLDVKTGNEFQSDDYYGVTTTYGKLVYEIDQTETDVMLVWNCDTGIERYFEVDPFYERIPSL
jgi:hypothetical protein